MRLIGKLAAGISLALVSGQLISAWVFSVRHTFDPVFGTIFAPGSISRYRLEGSGRSTWISHGIRREKEIDVNSPSKILVLGDSFTEALQVDDADTYVQRTEDLLAAAGSHATLLNAGKSSCSVADYVANAEIYLKTFVPAWTVVQVQEDDFTTDAWNQHKQNKGSCYFSRDPGTNLIRVHAPMELSPERRGFLRYFADWLRNRSALVQLALRRVEEFQVWVRHEPPLFRASQVPAVKTIPQSASWRDYPIDQEMEMLDHAYHGRLTVLYLSEFDPRHPGMRSEFEEHITKLCQKRCLSIVCTSSNYLPLAARGVAPFGFNNSKYNYGHMNSDGHKVVALALAGELERIERTHGIH
jgi:hypothetical protein